MKYKLKLLFLLAVVNLSAQEKPVILASASMIADMAKQVGGNLINLQTLVPIGGDPHLYEPTPGDARKVVAADIILINGLTFEGWINELIENSGTQAKVIVVTNGINPIKSSVYENAVDPHAWMDAANGIVYAANIKDALIEELPSKKEQVLDQFNQYTDQLKSLDQEIISAIQSIPEKQRYLITSHDAFHYYGSKYGIKTESILGTSTDADAQTSDIIRLNKIIEENKIPSVFIETTVNPKLLQSLAKDNKISIGGKLYSDSLGDENSPASTYIDMLRYNTKVIVEALTKPIEYVEEEEVSSNTLLIVLLAAAFILGFVILLKYIK